MVKNKKGGSSHKKMASKNFKKEFDINKVPLPINNVNEKTYLGIVVAPKGDKRFTFNLINKSIKNDDIKTFHLAGSVRKKVHKDALVLVSERLSLKEDTFDGIYVYGDKKELLYLISKGFISEDVASQTLAYTMANNSVETTEMSKQKSTFNDEDYLPPSYSDYEEEEDDEEEGNEEIEGEEIIEEESFKIESSSSSHEDERKKRKYQKSQQKKFRQMSANIKLNNSMNAHEYESAIDEKISIVNNDDEIIDIDDI